jgi:hypothetical protein
MLLIFRSYNFAPFDQFYQNCSSGLGVTGIFKVFFIKKIVTCQIFSQKGCKQNFGLKATEICQHHLLGSHIHNKNLRVLPKYKIRKLPSGKHLFFIFFCKKACQSKCFCLRSFQIGELQQQGKDTNSKNSKHTVKERCNFY